MRNFFSLMVVLFVASYNVNAQTPIPTSLKVTGKVADIVTGKPIEYASVVLLKQVDSSMVTGAYTTPTGTFSLNNITPGIYVVRITFMGYEKLEKAVRVTEGKNTLAGTLRLQPAGKVLNAVEIKAEKPAFSMQIDRQVFDAGNMINAEGGTGTDILKNIPSVDVDIDDNITLRGKSVTIYVDGKPSPFGDAKTALQMIPAESIDRVEVINNPSAKFEANGSGGIINIVLKKDKAIGYNVMFNVGGATRGEGFGSANASLRMKRFNFFANYNGRYEQVNGSGKSFRQNLIADSSDTWYFSQISKNENRNTNNGGRFGFDYFMDDHNTFTLSQGLNYNHSQNEDNILLNYMDQKMESLRNGERANNSYNRGNNKNTNLSYKHTFDKPNQELTAYISYSGNNSSSGSNYNTQYHIASVDTLPNADKQSNKGKNGNRFWNLQSDYTSPLGKKGKLEAGVKATMRHIDNNYVATLFDWDEKDYVISPTLSNKYDYEEDIYAGYLNFANAIGNLGYQVGVRAEQSQLKGYSFTKDTTVNNRFFNLFPSVFLKYNMPKNQNQSLVFNYSTRIDRPNFDQLLPYINNSDPQNIRTGNPELQPALSHKFEVSYSVYYPKSNNYLSTSTYFAQTNDNIDRISTLDTISGVTTTKPMNLATQQNMGGNVSYSLNLTKWWKVWANLNVEYSKLTSIAVNNENFSYGLNGNTQFRLPGKFSVELGGHFRSPRIQPQGTFKAMNGIDLGVRKELLNKSLVVALNISDLLNTQQFSSHYETNTFIQDYDRKRATRFIRLNVRYRFGKMDPNLFKKKKPQEEEEKQEEEKPREGAGRL
ncbi:TonB-dependent receptor [Chitinophaga ginsengisegetis]|uniref:outer membrane beta-barrel protein n=1 Tax=Chitinophaga ginsengisegetis TaxID=393003 RepID=UPI000DBA7924|nr:outer membrane beta-barrel protein [Chitinophaga ginsengisegetis]MDR6570467.1 outer membrane receptor protein involved in Fe transport [Chitinophaga ginsengisegetis]MDR6650201.1 outer membrane receptor protein involved in Fe transport [Chitinophaga ginsengisegetis]MDR6656680.1 outer membrane receptor protein involved in Fe transport [Chitinophaga ginsengisegetis]